jgi:tyrosine-specific transport protein
MNQKSSLLGGALLVAGTSIGGGMLALPVLTGVIGFLPSLVIYILCWILMVSTGLLFLETAQWMPQESNIISMANRTLGKYAKSATWFLYLFLYYSLLVAYIVGSGNLVVTASYGSLSDWMGPILFLLLFAPVILVSNYLAGKINIVLMFGLILSYFIFVFMGIRYINPGLLTYTDWSNSFAALPIAFTAFAYQGVIPTLISYMHHDIPRVRKAILIGSFIPFIAYVIWQALILGIVPVEGSGGLLEAVAKGQNAVEPLKNLIAGEGVYGEGVYIVGQFFAFFAMVTSFIGVTLGLRDFFADGLSINKSEVKGKLIIAGLVFLPPLLIAINYPHVFLRALDYAGGFGCALLLGLLPILMVWRGRYHLKLSPTKHCLGGGRVWLVVLASFVLLEVGLELRKMFF